MNRDDQAALLEGMIAAAAEAGAHVHLMATGIVARKKADSSPVTDADDQAEAIIEKHLARLLPGVPVIGEEAVARGAAPEPGRNFFLVDAIDGTREYIAGRSEYTVNIALVVGAAPLIGVVYGPALNELYAGGGGSAFRIALLPGADIAAADREPLRVQTSTENVTAAVSHSHLDHATERWLERNNIERTLKIGSSIKFARVAEGKADIYPRLAPVSEWDIAAGHALLVAAGGHVTSPNGDALRYGKNDQNYLVKGFIASSTPLKEPASG